MIRLFIFDFDGTLADTHEAIVTCVEATFDAFRHARPSRATITEAIGAGLSMPEVMRHLHGPTLDIDSAECWTARYRSLYDTTGLRQAKLFPGVIAILKRLREKGAHTAVVSNKGLKAVERALSHYGIRNDIDLVVGDHPGMPRKPDPAPYLRFVMPRFPGITAAQTIVVGDTQADIGFARAIGAQACWARYGYGDTRRCEQLTPEQIIDKFEDLKTYIA
ncbi:HAD family hydrolase [Paraburkholderia terrae]|uniref:HAD family hydrolase n=1 Tax=Paraburkholderia terrae TaxID=311230 RepID=UPI002059B75A|nr:HAD family hydrolase [Paraburkholderia terrae]BDC45925.1 phosphoglycolate phosphatase [Paraburkholderia terrae]